MTAVPPARRDEVFSIQEIARAAGVSVRQARAWAEAERIAIHKTFVKKADAVALVQSLRAPRTQSFK